MKTFLYIIKSFSIVVLVCVSVLSFFPCAEGYCSCVPGVFDDYTSNGNKISNSEWGVLPLTIIAVFFLLIDKRGSLLISLIASALIFLITLIVPFYLSISNSICGEIYEYNTLGHTVLLLSFLAILLIAVNIVIKKLIRNTRVNDKR